jgi:hypothetical protein
MVDRPLHSSPAVAGGDATITAAKPVNMSSEKPGAFVLASPAERPIHLSFDNVRAEL